ncbi:hypothetical protein [Streptomyces sp. NBC_01537]|uniref:hypothetical protein n=1 Tax=Streptomyces sp. NBC_01537 TaxID=2903896 RepID=UPI00386F1594
MLSALATGLSALAATATVAWLINSGRVPNVFDSRTRAAVPPTLACTTLRIDVPGYPFAVPGSPPTAAVSHVPTHAPLAEDCPAGATRAGVSPRLTTTRIAIDTSATSAARAASRV